jgi:putative FmdB family regulatory protein
LRSGLEVFSIGSGGGAGLPTYDYRCTKCGDEFCVEQSMTDKPLARCRKCRGKLEKLLPRSLNLIFKGSGFYVTDYRKPEPKGKEAATTEPKETSFKKAAEKQSSEKQSSEKKPGGEGTT